MCNGCVGSVNWTWEDCNECVHFKGNEECGRGQGGLDDFEEDSGGNLICLSFSDKSEWENTGRKPIYDPISEKVSQLFLFDHSRRTTPLNTVVSDDGEVMVKRGKIRNVAGGVQG